MVVTADIDAGMFPCIPGYSITQEIFTTSKTAVYRAIQLDSQQSVVIKNAAFNLSKL